MTQTQQPEALRIADLLEQCSLNSLLSPFMEVANELRRQQARIAELEDATDIAIERIAELEEQLSAIGAGGVEPLRKQAAETSNDILTMADALITQRTADSRDAARYRWLRDNDWHTDKDLGPVIRLQLNTLWDAKIDEAMRAKTKQGGQPGWCDGCSPDNCCGCGPGAVQAGEQS